MSILTAEDAKSHLNITTSDDDALLERKIATAETWVAQHLGYALDDVDQFPSGTPEPVLEAVRQLVGHLYADREGMTAPPDGIHAMLDPFKRVEF